MIQNDLQKSPWYPTRSAHLRLCSKAFACFRGVTLAVWRGSRRAELRMNTISDVT